jgi:phage shock protein PspC (stress-responsive transcriptional regulator)
LFPIVRWGISRHDYDMTEYNTNPDQSTTLRRSDDQRVFAGVCGGLGEHFGVNAWWFRWAFIILAFFGFAGIAIYIAAWLLIPDADSTESIAAGWFDNLDMSDTGTLFGVILISVAALIIATNVFHISGAIIIAIGLGVVGFLLYRGDLRPPVTINATVDDDDGPGPGGPSAPVDETLEVIDVETVTTTADSPSAGAAASVAATSVATKPPMAQKAPKPPKEKKPRPPKSMLGRLTMAVMLIALSTMALFELADIVHFEPYAYAAAAMGVVAVGLLVGAWIGRAYWLIIIGLLIAPVLFFSSLLPRVADWSVGDPVYLPTSADEISESYDLGVGQLTVDLTQVSAAELSKVGGVEASVGMGRLVVRLPSDVGATVNAEVGVGAVTGGQAFGSSVVNTYEYSGVGVDQVFTIGSPPHDLLLNLEVGMGEISIRYVEQFELGVNGIEG